MIALSPAASWSIVAFAVTAVIVLVAIVWLTVEVRVQRRYDRDFASIVERDRASSALGGGR